MKKSQISVEYAMILGFITLVSIPLLMVYYDYTLSSNEEIISQQVGQIAQRVVDSSESVYYLGEPSQTVLKVHIPNMIQSAGIEQGRVVFFDMKTRKGISRVIRISSVNITGSLPYTQGIHHITIKANNGKVELSYT